MEFSDGSSGQCGASFPGNIEFYCGPYSPAAANRFDLVRFCAAGTKTEQKI